MAGAKDPKIKPKRNIPGEFFISTTLALTISGASTAYNSKGPLVDFTRLAVERA